MDHFVRTDRTKRPERQVLMDAEIARGVEFWRNSLYLVTKERLVPPAESGAPVLVHLGILRHDRTPARDFRHLQAIKNELVGPECEGQEIYPAESRLLDAANQTHLWVFEDPAVRIPFGFDRGGIRTAEEAAEAGAIQRPFTSKGQRRKL